MYTVSVAQAIKKRQSILNTSMVITCILAFSILILVIIAIGVTDLSNWFILPALILSMGGTALGMMRDEIRAMKWQLWAFANVRNVHELKRIAEQDLLMYGQLSKMLPNKKFEEQWAALQERFETPDESLDDITLLDSVRIERSIWRIIKNSTLSFGLFAVPVSVIIYFQEEDKLFVLPVCLGLVALMILFSFNSFLMLFDKQRFIEVSEEGIRIGREGFFSWDEIKNENIRYWGETKTLYLDFDYVHIDHSKSIEVGIFKASRFELVDILHTYRIRHNKKENQLSK